MHHDDGVWVPVVDGAHNDDDDDDMADAHSYDYDAGVPEYEYVQRGGSMWCFVNGKHVFAGTETPTVPRSQLRDGRHHR